MADALAAVGAALAPAVEAPAALSVADVLEDTMLESVDLPEPTEVPVEAPPAAVVEVDAQAEPIAEDVAPGTVEPALVDAPQAEASAEPKPANEDVLGDLESWLNTLHDKSAE